MQPRKLVGLHVTKSLHILTPRKPTRHKYQPKWEDYLHLVEFAFNNGYEASLKMRPFEALYGRKCSRPVSWDNPVDRAVVGPDLLQEMEEQMVKIEHNLKSAQDRRKNCADKGKPTENLEWVITCF